MAPSALNETLLPPDSHPPLHPHQRFKDCAFGPFAPTIPTFHLRTILSCIDHEDLPQEVLSAQSLHVIALRPYTLLITSISYATLSERFIGRLDPTPIKRLHTCLP